MKTQKKGTCRSWRKIVEILLLAVLLTVLVFLVWTNAYFFFQNTRQVIELNENALSLWIGTTESRLDTVNEHIREILLTIYENTVVTDGTTPLTFQTERKCLSAIEDKLSISKDADCFFIFDTKSDKFFFSANPSLAHVKIMAMKTYAGDEITSNLTTLNDKSWYVARINGEACFIKGSSVGRYIAGAICQVSNFNITETLEVMDTDNSFLIQCQEDVFFAGGTSDWSDDLETTDSGKTTLDHNRILVSGDFSFVNGKMLLAFQGYSFFGGDNRFYGFFLISFSLIVVALLLLLITVLRRKVERPLNNLMAAHRAIEDGNIQYRIDEDPGSQEFRKLFDSFNSMAEQIQYLRIESYDRLIRNQANRLQMVRAQIRPHFYLNAITTVYNMTYQNRLEDIRSFVQALGKYMRYMLNIKSETIPVEEELSHIENYLKMQQIRFPGSVNYTIECAEEINRIQIPFLVLFTLVENTFKHALDLYKPMVLNIICQVVRQDGFHGCRLMVEDNGNGFPEDVLESFNAGIPEEELPAKEHLGLTNIRYTLHFTYHRSDLLRLSNTGQGARAEIWIPCEGETLTEKREEP